MHKTVCPAPNHPEKRFERRDKPFERGIRMKRNITRTALINQLGKEVCIVKNNGRLLNGKLVKVKGNRLFLQQKYADGKKARTSALVPLVLFDLLAVEQAQGPFGPYGPYGPGPFGYEPYGFYGGYPGLFW